jgi:hypothetical protein
MPIAHSITRYTWILVTVILTAAVLINAVGDLFLSFQPELVLGSCFYGLVSVLSILVRFRMIYSGSKHLVSAAGIASAGIAAFALAGIFSPGAIATLIDASGAYLVLGIWLFGLDVIYREIEISRFGGAQEMNAGE